MSAAGARTAALPGGADRRARFPQYQLSEDAMPTLLDRTTGAVIAQLSPEQLQIVMDSLAGSAGGADEGEYTLSPATLQLLEEQGADEALIALLREALGTSEGLELQWTL